MEIYSLNVIVACAAGAYSSFSFGESVEPRRKMFSLFVTCIIMGWATTLIGVAAIEHFLYVDGKTVTAATQAGMGAVISCMTRFLWPPIVDALKTGRWINWLPFVKNSKGE